VYQQAKQIFDTFLSKASGKPEYDGAVKKSKERMQDIDDTINFLQAGGPSTPPPAATPAAATPSDDAGAGPSTAASNSAPAPDGGPAPK
jgi:hypothetical protein